MAHEYLITNISANNLLKYFQPGETLRYKFNGVEYTDTVKSFYQEPMSESPEEYEYFYVGKLPDYDEMETSGDHSVYIYKDGYGDLNAFIISYDDVTSFKIFGGMKDIPTAVYVEDESTIEPKLKEAYLPEEVMTESEEGYVISKALNDLNKKINTIDVSEQVEKVKKDIEKSSLWIEKSDGYVTKNASPLTSCWNSFIAGSGAFSDSGYSVAIGNNSSASGRSVAIGSSSNGGYYGISIGSNATSDHQGIAIGPYAENNSENGISIGYFSSSNNSKEIAIGACNSSTSGDGSKKENTHFSIASPDATYSARKNVLEIMRDGQLFIFGLGDYTGVYSNSAKSIQTIIEEDEYVTARALLDLNSRVNTLNNNLSWNII